LLIGSTSKSLIWSAVRDGSPRVRLVASTALVAYLESVKAFFSIAAAEGAPSSESLAHTHTNSSFEPISYKLGSIIRHMHRELLSAFSSPATFTINRIQLLKCLQQLAKSTPYEKLKPGLIYKLIIYLTTALYKSSEKSDSQLLVNVEILKCMQLILNTHHQLAEVHLALLSPLKNENDEENVSDRMNEKQSRVSSGISASFVDIEDKCLSSKLESLNGLIKVPSVAQTRVTYFYTSENYPQLHSPSICSSTGGSNSGAMTPLQYSMSDLLNNRANATSSNKCWLVGYCIEKSAVVENSRNSNDVNIACLDVLLVIAKKYFDLLHRDLFFDPLCEMIMNNISVPFLSSDGSFYHSNHYTQQQLQTLRLLEEFGRCLATSELRSRNGIDLNDCCKFWSELLQSALVLRLLNDEQNYMLSSGACDCLASIGAQTFELIPFAKRVHCLTSLLHLTKSSSTLIRSASVRALGVYVTFGSLKEDLNFLYDMSNCLHALLSTDSNNLVRQKAAWSLGNLSEVLVENVDKLGKSFTEEFHLRAWLGLLDSAANTCMFESDKLRPYLVRALGNLINYITKVEKETILAQLKNIDMVQSSIGNAVLALCACKNSKMLKVKWNLSHAIGIALLQFNNGPWMLSTANPNWLTTFYDTLFELFSQSTNYKVRINACVALMSICIGEIERQGSERSVYMRMWNSLLDGFGKLNNEANLLTSDNQHEAKNEIQHKANLLQQVI
jgi:hypothetical protein